MRYLLAIILASLAVAHAQPAAMAPLSIRITEESMGLMARPGSQLVAELRGDTPASKQLIEDLWQRYHAAFPPSERINYGPDSSFTQIKLVHGSEVITVGSWHTAEWTNPKLFASASGLGSLGDRTREQALAAQPESYRRFREAFDAIYKTVTKAAKPKP